MKKLVLYISLILVICGCQKKEEYQLIFESESIMNCNRMVFEFDDGTRIYSSYENIQYKTETQEMTIEEALEKRLIDFEDVKGKFDVYDKDDVVPFPCSN